jgi:hypothetical protein
MPTRYHLVFCPRSTCAGFWPNLFRFRSWSVLDGICRCFRRRRRKTAERESIGFRQRRRVIGCRRGRSSSIGQRCCPHRYDARSNARPHRDQDAHGDKANQGEPNGPSHRIQGITATKSTKKATTFETSKTAGRMARGPSGAFGIRTCSAPERHSRPRWPTGNYDSGVPGTHVS